jgi:hypothetical protein
MTEIPCGSVRLGAPWASAPSNPAGNRCDRSADLLRRAAGAPKCRPCGYAHEALTLASAIEHRDPDLDAAIDLLRAMASERQPVVEIALRLRRRSAYDAAYIALC